MIKKVYFFVVVILMTVCLVTGCANTDKPRDQQVQETIRSFIQALNNNDLPKAQSFLAEESLAVAMPVTRLGKAIRENLRIMDVTNIQGSDFIIADVTLEALDLYQIMSRATLEYFWTSGASEMNLEMIQTDEALAKIYDTILNEEDASNLPRRTVLGIFTLVNEKGIYKILLDESLQNVLNGNLLEAAEKIQQILKREKE